MSCSCPNVLVHAGKHRDHDDRDDHQLEVPLNDLSSAEPPAGQQEKQDPDGSARDVEDGEPPVAHLADAGDERGERPDDRDEPRQDDRDAAVFLVEVMGS